MAEQLEFLALQFGRQLTEISNTRFFPAETPTSNEVADFSELSKLRDEADKNPGLGLALDWRL